MVSAPEMIVGARVLSVSWVPARRRASESVTPSGCRAHAEGGVTMTQYVVDSAVQTSELGAHSVALLGIDLEPDQPASEMSPAPQLVVAGVVSTPEAQDFYARRGVPTRLGDTSIEFRGDSVIGLTTADDTSIARVVASVGLPRIAENGTLAYVRMQSGEIIEERHPWIATVAETWSLTSLELLDASGTFALLAPGEPPEIVRGSYSPNASMCIPGGTVVPDGDPWRGRFTS